MHKLFAALASAAVLMVSIPAFACGGHEAKADTSDETVVTSGDEKACTHAEGTCDHADAKKDTEKKKAQAQNQSSAGDA